MLWLRIDPINFSKGKDRGHFSHFIFQKWPFLLISIQCMDLDEKIRCMWVKGDCWVLVEVRALLITLKCKALPLTVSTHWTCCLLCFFSNTSPSRSHLSHFFRNHNILFAEIHFQICLSAIVWCWYGCMQQMFCAFEWQWVLYYPICCAHAFLRLLHGPVHIMYKTFQMIMLLVGAGT